MKSDAENIELLEKQFEDFRQRYTITAGIPLDRLEEICRAERDGRCVVLECKRGDRIYIKDNSIKSGLRTTRLESYLIYAENNPRIYVKSTATSTWYPIEYVSIAKPEAEAALERLEEGSTND